MLYRKIKIGSLQVPGNIFLAPMAGISDMAFRKLCAQNGADLTYTEMVSAEGLFYNSKKTEALLKKSQEEKYLAVQIFSGNEDMLIKAAEKLENTYHPCIIDINSGCPVPKVTKTGAGAALMREPQKIYRIINEIKKRIITPITIKIRSGWNQEFLNYMEIATAAIEAGVDALCIHPRTKTQGYSGFADRTHIKNIKEKFPQLVVIASGDINSPEEVESAFLETGCDAVMIARGSMGKPWIFRQTKEYLNYGKYKEPDISEIKNTMLRHLEYAIEEKGERTAVKELRKHMAWYIKGIPHAAKLRKDFISCQSQDDYKRLIDSIS
ncbi:tRNA dihydrouridine synthase DusB [Spirochaetia bacterium 38H-sp]|uniref:tRNA-dihydrouridine synthase n=1 Tax=Rarispira pelagica TaxID=3141764 RepID=A0ABU9UDT2_9SPIR